VSQHFITRAILNVVRARPGFPKLRVLDLSCGRGEILADLERAGCEVRGTHFRDDDYEIKSGKESFLSERIPIDTGIDLTQPLPYVDGSFDLVILSEVVEHLPTYLPVVREAGRVLRQNGALVLSTPNIARLHSRWHFFWTGTHKLIRERVGWHLRPGELYAYHIAPVDFPLLHTVLFQGGLRVQRLRFTRFKPQHAWLLLFYPLVWLATRLETARSAESDLHAEGERDLFRWMTHPAMLASEQLLLIAEKRT
jgi:2-polyprenyl-3-methyl-5-hydroxy-6-metoxy-1,4-benzoquinol methylase